MQLIKQILELARRRRLLRKAKSAFFQNSRTRRQLAALQAPNPTTLSIAWLIQLERHYAKQRVVVQDHDASADFGFRQMFGADRMALDCNAYAAAYAEILQDLDTSRIRHVVEIGILSGTGLAMWSSIFPNAQTTGVDINIERTRDSLDGLTAAGAFPMGEPSLLEVDATAPDLKVLQEHVAAAPPIDFVVDDGPHTHSAIEAMASALKPFLSERFTYVIEDNPGSLGVARNTFSGTASIARSDGLVIART